MARRRLKLLALLSVLAFGTACDALFGPGRPELSRLDALPRALSAHEREVIRASNGFAFDILRETIARSDEPNVFLSPLSASLALGMTLNGARGETFDAMRSALGFDALEREQINASYRDLIELLRGLDRGTELRIANAIWARQGFPLHQSFIDESRHYFDAEVATLDFTSPAALTTINDWVRRQTANRIPKVLDGIAADYVMFLINAIHFEGRWRERFDRAQTSPATFRLEDGTQRTVNMMRRTGSARVHVAEDAAILELPYGRDAFVMTLVLPPPGGSVDELVRTLDSERWNAWLEGLSAQEVHIGLPRFRLEYEVYLNEPLIALGMGRAFGAPGPADFTGMSPAGGMLEIGFVKQNTFVEVDEDGTVAAAATTVGMRVTSGPPSFVVDRPFIVAIRERLSGTILFLGRVAEPAG
jgi:serine protease inhibitor